MGTDFSSPTRLPSLEASTARKRTRPGEEKGKASVRATRASARRIRGLSCILGTLLDDIKSTIRPAKGSGSPGLAAVAN